MAETALTVDGVRVPRFLYGTAWKEDATQRLTELALKQGFRAIDTANQRRHYDEAAVGLHASDSGYQRYVNEWEGINDAEFTPFKAVSAFAAIIGSQHRSIVDTVSSAIGHGLCTRFPRIKIAPGGRLNEVLVFDDPGEGAASFVLELPGAAVGELEPFRIPFPATLLTR